MLSTLCNLCRVMAENKEISKKFENEETQLFVLSVMVRFDFAFPSLQLRSQKDATVVVWCLHC